jgi:hypothetical protein
VSSLLLTGICEEYFSSFHFWPKNLLLAKAQNNWITSTAVVAIAIVKSVINEN